MSFFSKKCLGIDIGISSIKVVEVSYFAGKIKLLNYAGFKIPKGISPIGILWDRNFSLLSDRISDILKTLLQRAKIRTKKAFLALPDFSVFCTTFTLPLVTEKEIAQAVEFEARHRIPLPLPTVNFDWEIVGEQPGTNPQERRIKVLLVAAPKRIINRYQRMALLTGLQLRGLEAEIFSLARVSKAESGKPFCLVDIGFKTSTVSVVKKKVIESYSFDVSSQSITEKLAEGIGISLEKAEALKIERGLDVTNKEAFKIISGQLNELAIKIDSVCEHYYQVYGEVIEDIEIAGGAALLPGLEEYFKNFFKKNVSIINPFKTTNYPPLLTPRLKQLSPSFAIALGAAIRGVNE